MTLDTMQILLLVIVGIAAIFVVMALPDKYRKVLAFIAGGFAIWALKLLFGGTKSHDHAATKEKIDDLAKPHEEVKVPDLVGPTKDEADATDKVTADLSDSKANLERDEAKLEAELTALNKKKKELADTVSADEPVGPDDDVASFITSFNEDKS